MRGPATEHRAIAATTTTMEALERHRHPPQAAVA